MQQNTPKPKKGSALDTARAEYNKALAAYEQADRDRDETRDQMSAELEEIARQIKAAGRDADAIERLLSRKPALELALENATETRLEAETAMVTARNLLESAESAAENARRHVATLQAEAEELEPVIADAHAQLPRAEAEAAQILYAAQGRIDAAQKAHAEKLAEIATAKAKLVELAGEI